MCILSLLSRNTQTAPCLRDHWSDTDFISYFISTAYVLPFDIKPSINGWGKESEFFSFNRFLNLKSYNLLFLLDLVKARIYTTLLQISNFQLQFRLCFNFITFCASHFCKMFTMRPKNNFSGVNFKELRRWPNYGCFSTSASFSQSLIKACHLEVDVNNES